MSFGNILKVLLKENNLTQKQFAVDLNLAASTVSSYVQNTRQPDFEILCRIARYFNVSTDYLLNYHTEAQNSPLESELLHIFRGLSPEHQKIYIEQGKVFNKIKSKEKITASNQI